MTDPHDELTDDQLETAAGGLAASPFDAPRFDDAPLKPSPGIISCPVAPTPSILVAPKPLKTDNIL